MARWNLGVDLGTTSCAGATVVVAGGEARVEPLEIAGDRRVPSTVLLDGDRLLAGPFAHRSTARSPDRAELNPKRYVGRPPMLLGGVGVSAARALGEQLRLFVDEGRRRFDGAAPDLLVLTHPVVWTDAQCGVLRTAAASVLPEVTCHLMPEPVAAAWHYAHDFDLRAGEGVAVYDLGGGTFDAAVLAYGPAGFEVVGTPDGDPEIGGEFFDARVYQQFGEQLARSAPEWWDEASTSPERKWMLAATDLLREARLAKETLSEYPTASQYIPGADVDVTIDRGTFESLIADDVARTDRILAEVIDGSGVEGDRVRGIFLTGGASRTPLVETTLRARYPGLVRRWADPKTAVALGAARWAGGRPARTVLVEVPAGLRRQARAAAAPKPPATPEPLVEGVVAARATPSALYTLGAPDRSGRTLLRRHGPDGTESGGLVFAELAGWAASEHGMLVAERAGPAVRVHVLGPDLSPRAVHTLTTARDPVLVVDGDLGWVQTWGPELRTVGPSDGLPHGVVAGVVVYRVSFAAPPGTPPVGIDLGRTGLWCRPDAGGVRRLLDPASPTGRPLHAIGDGRAVGVVRGVPQRARRVPFGARPDEGPDQSVAAVTSAGAHPLGEIRRGAPWVQQLARASDQGPWYLATSGGLETADTVTGTGRRLHVQRPAEGAARWVLAGGVVVGAVTDGAGGRRGLELHVLADGRWRTAGRRAGLLGNLLSLHPADRPRIVTEQGRVWVGAENDAGGSDLIELTADGSRLLQSLPGWLEPVGRCGSTLVALHALAAPPGDRLDVPGRLVSIPAS